MYHTAECKGCILLLRHSSVYICTTTWHWLYDRREHPAHLHYYCCTADDVVCIIYILCTAVLSDCVTFLIV